MLLEAADRLKIDLSRSWIVGDQASDIEAGRAAKLRGGVLALSGQTTQGSSGAVSSSDGYKVRVAYSLAACLFLVGYMNVETAVSEGEPSAKPRIDRDAYNKAKQDEEWIRQKLGLARR